MARWRGEEYLLERQPFRRRSPRWHYDVLCALDHFRRIDEAPDQRIDDAVQLVRDKQGDHGTWLLENTHPGATQFEFEDGDGQPSRWNTPRPLRILDWYQQRW